MCSGKGRLGGAKTPEQRSSAATLKPVCMTGEGGMSMKKKNNSAAPQLQVNWKHLFLVVLHLLVFVVSALCQDFTKSQVAAGALPQAIL